MRAPDWWVRCVRKQLRAVLGTWTVVTLALACSDVPEGRVDSAAEDVSSLDGGSIDALGDSGPVGAAESGADGGPDALVAPDPNRADNDRRDSDCDGLSDQEEFSVVWPGSARTDPAVADSDGDGLPDGLEAGRTASVDVSCGYVGDGDQATRTSPTTADSDRDGLPDGDEDANRDGVFDPSGETDPTDPDTDADGLCDGPSDVSPDCAGLDPEPYRAGVGADADGDGVTDALDAAPGNPDRDADGLCDGPSSVSGVCVRGEDLDGNGHVDSGESDPDRIDSDCDGLVDGPSAGNFIGESTMGTDPTNPDSDSDGVLDGIETGVTAAPDPGCVGFVADADPTTQSDPSRPDTDGDGVADGAEDSNGDGAVGADELDPTDPLDVASDPTVSTACSASGLVRLHRHRAVVPDQQVLTADRSPNAFLETSVIRSAQTVVGQTGFNAELGVVFLTLTKPAEGVDALAEEALGQARVSALGTLTTPITRSFTTWDGYPAVSATYELGVARGPRTIAAELVTAYFPGATGALDPTTDISSGGSLRVFVQYTRRSSATAVVLFAIAPIDASEAAGFALADLTEGLGLGQSADELEARCQRFRSEAFSALEIVWAVDNSASMGDEQNAVAEAALALVSRLSNAAVDWRTAVVTSGFYAPRAGCTNETCSDTTESQCRVFTSDLPTFAGWFTQGSPSWVGAGGACNVAREEAAHSLQLILTDPAAGHASFMPPSPTPDPAKIRSGSDLLVIFLGDADDQQFGNADAESGMDGYEAFFRALPLHSVSMGGIICPEGGTCGETQRNPRVIRGLINRFGGLIGSLRDLTSIGPTVAAIVDAGIGAASPYELDADAIPSTIRVSMQAGSTVGSCPVDDVPRSRTNGFDYDARTRRIAFFGDCRPAGSGSSISVSYRAWTDRSSSSDPVPCLSCGSCPQGARCDLDTCACVCEVSATCSPGYAWDAAACGCVCSAEALGCSVTHTADVSLCACVCRPDCGGCLASEMCSASLCACRPRDI
ncbi:MAG: hypothetical protein HY791_14110 [Deltaproteobacteria bacterium]|nr:hypothetical protein [Deltaproteobacteria bacterium]